MVNPRRKYRITLEVEGHTFEAALHELLHMADHIREHGEECSSVGGGGPSSHMVTVNIHPTMTPEQFESDLETWKREHDAALEKAKAESDRV